MGSVRVRFEWWTGLDRSLFHKLDLAGSWTRDGRYSNDWSKTAMVSFVTDDGCPAWRADVDFDASEMGWTFHWGVFAAGAFGAAIWGIPTECADSTAQTRSFVLAADMPVQRYRLTTARHLGANKVFADTDAPAIRFSVFAPSAKGVEVAIGEPKSGYIYNSEGSGTQRLFAMSRGPDGIWQSGADPALSRFADWDHVPYMFRIQRDDGSIRYRTDLFARCQIGAGRNDPEPPTGSSAWNGTRQDLKGTKGCSLVIDPEKVTALLEEPGFPPRQWLGSEAFWANEFDPMRPVPDTLAELVIYELHVEGLFTGTSQPGTFEHAIRLLDHLVELGINAIEMLPTSEAESWTWGYGTSHHFATEYAGGGRDQLKHFVRACHRRGIAVLLDVVYNHFVADAERAEWLYDTADDAKSPYYWYEGQTADWPSPRGGYLDNGSTGFTPNFRSELVRQMFASSAAIWLAEFHIDGFRVDLTQAMHRDNVRHADGAAVPEANRFGAKLLREWVRTLRLVKPSVMVTAEDHTGWRAITQPQATGGIGFDAAWFVDWYHNLIGDSQSSSDNARLLHQAGFGDDAPLAMGRFADVLRATPSKVIYHESHDQAGNATYAVDGRTFASARTIQVAVNGHLDAASRPWAEARCRVAAGLTLLTPGVPMFFMGEEVGAKEPYRYNDWIDHREDFLAMKAGDGAALFAFYRDLIGLRRQSAAIRSDEIEVLHTHDVNRVVAFRRVFGADDLIVVASLANRPFGEGYDIANDNIPESDWVEALNSDATAYGGSGLGNPLPLRAAGGRLSLRLPANSIHVLRRI